MQYIYQAAKANTNAEKTLFEQKQFITPESPQQLISNHFRFTWSFQTPTVLPEPPEAYGNQLPILRRGRSHC